VGLPRGWFRARPPLPNPGLSSRPTSDELDVIAHRPDVTHPSVLADAHPELEGKSADDADQPASTGGCCGITAADTPAASTTAAEKATAAACC
jgi:hypothetical protein